MNGYKAMANTSVLQKIIQVTFGQLLYKNKLQKINLLSNKFVDKGIIEDIV